jgi:hypothetical protein
MVQFVRNKQKLEGWQPSPLFTYYVTRLMEKTVSVDGGAQVRNALKSTVNHGVVKEDLWAYDTSKVFIRPDKNIFEEGLKHQTLEYHRIADGFIDHMRQCLHEGYPFTFGLMLWDSFNSEETIKTGLVKTPNYLAENGLGGHCMLCVGWKMLFGEIHFIVQNSWGTNWGDKGYCYIPASYIRNTTTAFDFWTIRLEEGDEPPVVPPVIEPPVIPIVPIVNPPVTPVIEPPVKPVVVPEVKPVINPPVTPVVEPPVKPIPEKKKSFFEKIKGVFNKIKKYIKNIF